MEIKDRLKEIRRKYSLTQQEFADRLGIKRNTVASYETGKSNPSDSAVVLICREFNVCEKWLRTGEGKMFNPDSESELDMLARKYNLTEPGRILIENFITLKPEQRNAVVDYIRKIAADFDNLSISEKDFTAMHTPDIASAEAEYEKRLNIAPHTESTASSTTKNTENKRIG